MITECSFCGRVEILCDCEAIFGHVPPRQPRRRDYDRWIESERMRVRAEAIIRTFGAESDPGRRFHRGQSRLASFAESCVNVAIGYTVALASQLIIFPLYGISVTLGTNLAIGAWFTVISIARSYVLRRVFNKGTIRGSPNK